MNLLGASRSVCYTKNLNHNNSCFTNTCISMWGNGSSVLCSPTVCHRIYFRLFSLESKDGSKLFLWHESKDKFEFRRKEKHFTSTYGNGAYALELYLRRGVSLCASLFLESGIEFRIESFAGKLGTATHVIVLYRACERRENFGPRFGFGARFNSTHRDGLELRMYVRIYDVHFLRSSPLFFACAQFSISLLKKAICSAK